MSEWVRVGEVWRAIFLSQAREQDDLENGWSEWRITSSDPIKGIRVSSHSPRVGHTVEVEESGEYNLHWFNPHLRWEKISNAPGICGECLSPSSEDDYLCDECRRL